MCACEGECHGPVQTGGWVAVPIGCCSPTVSLGLFYHDQGHLERRQTNRANKPEQLPGERSWHTESRRCAVLPPNGHLLVIFFVCWMCQFFRWGCWSAENETASAYEQGCCSWDCADPLSQTGKNTRFVPHTHTPAAGFTTRLPMVSFSRFSACCCCWELVAVVLFGWVISSFLARCVAVARLREPLGAWARSVSPPLP